MSAAERRLVRVRGVVQGVGFRPFVHGLATELDLAGTVENDGAGVLAEVEGDPAALAAFVAGLRDRAPVAAKVEAVEVIDAAPVGGRGFRIAAGVRAPGTRTAIPPDLATCADCLRELRDPGDRRHRHAFISCTACGPRFTILTGLPYDRARTTMAAFPLCAACRAEYEDPRDRRFHAETICCPDCGPALRLVHADGSAGPAGDGAVVAARDLLAAGGIVAVKGLGGFHLACDAAGGPALARLRAAKGREAKPFAVMAADLAAAGALGETSPAEAALLSSPQAPIVLLRRRADAPVHDLVAPGSPWLGVLLPYTPVHQLLLGRPGARALVMTSGNRADEPIAFEDGDAAARLAPLADALLTHDRPIAAPCDDSIARVHARGTLPLRRSRGFAPLPLPLPVAARAPILAVGGELKAAVAIAVGREAVLGQHLGDVGDPATLEALERSTEHLTALLDAAPLQVACDLHPGYRSSRWAQRHAGTRRVHRVQHHHAHAAAVLAEHGRGPDDEVAAIVFDGSGYGTDGAIWGGEVLAASCRGFRRIAHLSAVPLPGGDLAIRRPARMALAHLWAAGLPWDDDLPPVAALGADERAVIRHQLETGLNAPPTTSVGRLFDAVAALAGVCMVARYEGEAATLLEGLAAGIDAPPYPIELAQGDPVVIAAAPIIAGVALDLRAGAAADHIAARLHASVAAAAAAGACAARERRGLTTAALSGGVFQNVRLLDLTTERLQADGFTVLAHGLVPPNDGGLALGQAAIAAAAPEAHALPR